MARDTESYPDPKRGKHNVERARRFAQAPIAKLKAIAESGSLASAAAAYALQHR